jgi:hypothetical protein
MIRQLVFSHGNSDWIYAYREGQQKKFAGHPAAEGVTMSEGAANDLKQVKVIREIRINPIVPSESVLVTTARSLRPKKEISGRDCVVR